MSRSLTASDRSALIRLASSLPKGNPTRRGILAGLKRVAEEAEEEAKPKGGKKKPGSMLKKFLAEVGDQKAKNPDTGNEVKVKTLAGKPKDSKAYKIFKDQFDKWMEEQDKDEEKSKDKKPESKDKKPESKKKPLIEDKDSSEFKAYAEEMIDELSGLLVNYVDEDFFGNNSIEYDPEEEPVEYIEALLDVIEDGMYDLKDDGEDTSEAEETFKELKDSLTYNLKLG